MQSSSLLTILAVATLALLLATPQTATAASLKRSTNTCSRTSPCGWLVYQPYVRTPDYYVRSPCSCSADTRCVRTSDDVSISAYVYRCRSSSEAEGLDVLPDNIVENDTSENTSNE